MNTYEYSVKVVDSRWYDYPVAYGVIKCEINSGSNSSIQYYCGPNVNKDVEHIVKYGLPFPQSVADYMFQEKGK